MEKFKSIYHISSLATDVQLNSTMRLIFGTLRSTPLPWLPVLSNIERQLYEERLPLTSWWRKSSNIGP